MSVKKRLYWSHILMFVLPLVVYLLFSLLADRLSWMWLLQQRFQSMPDFQRAVQRTEIFSRWFTLAGLLGTLFVVNRMLSRGVLRTIEQAVDELSAGLRHLREEDLAFRLEADKKDEFSAVRADFNATAARLQQLVEQERQNETSRQELLAGISHDLRSPLTSIRAYAEGLLDGVARTDEARTQYLTIIRDKTRDIQGLVNKLFLFSRMDLGRNEDHPEPVSLSEELTALHRVLAPEYGEKGLTIHLEVPEKAPCRVLADPETLRRVAVNIVENSAKYGASELRIGLRQQPGYLSVTFADDGPGVPPQALPHIFDAFYRADPARNEKISGSGLGLAIVSRAVRNMNGRIIARNVQPHGLLLEIQLPCLED